MTWFLLLVAVVGLFNGFQLIHYRHEAEMWHEVASHQARVITAWRVRALRAEARLREVKGQ